jgi:hypothetical protein
MATMTSIQTAMTVGEAEANPLTHHQTDQDRVLIPPPHHHKAIENIVAASSSHKSR